MGIEPYIIECMCLNLHDKESLQYLEDRGYSISRMELYRIKNEIKDNTQERLNLIASSEFLIAAYRSPGYVENYTKRNVGQLSFRKES